MTDMEKQTAVNLHNLYINSIDTILDESRGVSNETYEFIYQIIYGKYKDLDTFANQLETQAKERLSKMKIDMKESFESSNVFTPEEKQKIVDYWTVSALDNYAKESNEKGVDLSFVFEKHVGIVMGILSNKEISCKNRKLSGKEVFGTGSNNKKSTEQAQINESLTVVATIAIGFAIGIIGAAITPTVAKSSPKLCNWARNFKDKFPILSTVVDWTASPLDLEVLAEQDRINKGEVKPGEEEGPHRGVVEKFMKEHGYEYVKTDTYTYGTDFDDNGNYIGNR